MILFVSNSIKNTINFRGEVIKSFKDRGHDVALVGPIDVDVDEYWGKVVPFYEVKIASKGINPITDLQLCFSLFSLYKKIKPQVVYHYTIKPNIYGSMVSGILGIKNIAVTTGLGYVFIHDNLISFVAKALYKLAFYFSEQVWFLNQDDQDKFVQQKLVDPKKVRLLDGEGIDTNFFKPVEKTPSSEIKVLQICRMLKDKGVFEFVEAARILKSQGAKIEFQLLGPADVDNPTSVTVHQLKQWESEGLIKYLGTSSDVRQEILNSDICVLASYREGVPRVLMEAASMEKPIVTTNTIGCREVVLDGVNGFLCEAKNSQDLADKILKISGLNENERIEMGKKGRQYMIDRFSIEKIKDFYFKNLSSFSK